MHFYTLVITPGPRRSAIARAEKLLDEALSNYCDYWGTGGWYADRLGRRPRPELDALRDERERWFRECRRENAPEQPGGGTPEPGDARGRALVDPIDFDLGLGTFAGLGPTPFDERIRLLEQQAIADRCRLTSSLPRPLDDSMVPFALIKPDGRWRICPSSWTSNDPRWIRWVNATVDRFRGGHCAVTADCHC